MLPLANKNILVTGSTHGIGRAIAKHCVKAGAKVMVHGRNEKAAKALCAELGEEVAQYVIADLSEFDSAEKVVRAVLHAYGEIHGLVNNAGISPRHNVETISEKDFDYVMAINLRSPMFLSKFAVEAFRKQKGGGVIVNIGSINAHCGQTDLLIYSATKGGLMTMTRNLGDALGKEGIRVIQLNVGWTVTQNEKRIKQGEGFPDDWEKLIPKVYAPSGRLLRPEDIAKHAIFWLSEQSAPANAVVYELEQYPVIGRNLISELDLKAAAAAKQH